jgi:dihydropteroate synthase
MTRAAAAPEDFFGAAALRLAPRCLDSLSLSGTAERAERTSLAFRASLDEIRTLQEFEALRGGLQEARAREDLIEVRLRQPTSSLRERAAQDPRARALLAAHDSVHAPRQAPRIVGVLNVTPDSFSEGEREGWDDPGRVRERGSRLVAEGAAMLDVGGESTRPGAAPVTAEEELRRVLPAIEALARATDVPLSVDTSKAEVAERALDLGARVVNDVSAGRFDPAMIPLVVRRGCDYVLMHMQGTPRDMQADPRYGDVVAEVTEFLRGRAAACWAAGIDPKRLIVDPGIGFGKRAEHNLELLARLSELRSLGLSILVGVSRKSFIERVNERAGASSRFESDPRRRERLGGTAAAVALCVQNGAELLRVHDVGVMAEAARVAHAIATAT